MLFRDGPFNISQKQTLMSKSYNFLSQARVYARCGNKSEVINALVIGLTGLFKYG